MTRIRQLYPNNYQASSFINSEFANILRYLQAAEKGNQTVGELMDKLFDDDGNFDAAVDFRLDTASGLQYRIGEFDNVDEGWETIAPVDELRGTPGLNFGEVTAPVFHSRLNIVAAGGETTISYATNADETVFFWKDGVLMREGEGFDYTSDGSTLSLASALTANQRISLMKMRINSSAPANIYHHYAVAPQSVFPITHDRPEDILVFRDGVLMTEGDTADYISTPLQNYITFNSAQLDVLITIVQLWDTVSQTVSGFLLAQDYADKATGMLSFERIGIEDGQIPQAKVKDLITALNARATIYVDNFEPASPVYPSFWLDTSQATPDLYVYNGSAFALLTTTNNLPTWDDTLRGRYLRVSPTDTGLEWAVLDLSGYVEKNSVGANSGVASLDLQGRLPTAQLPEVISRHNVYYHSGGALADGQHTITRLYRTHERVSGISLRAASGTCSVTVTVSGVKVGSTYSVSSVPQEFALGSPIEINALTASAELGIDVASGNAPNDVEVVLVCDQLNTTVGG